MTRLSELGWQSKVSLRAGVERTYAWYLENADNLRTLKADNLAR